MRVYISGPISGTNDYKQRFKKAQQELEAAGHEAINPVAVAEVLPASLNYNHYMTIDMAMLTAAEGIYMLKGWQESSGAIEEYKIAAATHKKVLFETQEEQKEE